MREIPALVLESFARNGRVNAALIAALTADDLTRSNGPDGNTIAELLAHIADFRRGWLSRISPAHAEQLTRSSDQAGVSELQAAFEAGDRAALEAVQAAYAEGRTFEAAYRSDPAHFLQHTLVHDSHHRGQIFTLLRQSGRSAEQMDEIEEAVWPIWRE
ncbi:DinB family protein [Deinococcus sp. KNUC1210]|uniref:DinB family protein n=1 Tax=Deinococcus sp. KNUC1210 TaxID=2917691 RepID=UPI001EF0301E|nr:DinB family protein [Deinococcus sp. KNUC1210]ULH16313.1 DinB family protein [Deinococcus sp. KNUC1210]